MRGKDVAKMCLVLADTLELTKEDRMEMFMELASRLFLDIPIANETVSHRQVESSKTSSNPHGKVLATAGSTCVCNSCKKVAYKVKNDVYAEGMTGEEFLGSFSPEPKAPLDMLTDEYGNEMVDCPKCKGSKTVPLIRRDRAVT